MANLKAKGASKGENRNKSKGGPVSVIKKNKILEEIHRLIRNGQIDKVEYQTLAKQYNTTYQTISKYVDEAYINVPAEEINKVLVDFRYTFKRLEEEVNVCLIEAETVKQKLDVIKTYFQLIKEKTDYMERFFIKAKAQENINIQGEIDNVITVNIVRSNKIIEAEAK